jgi:hypothetical protein
MSQKFEALLNRRSAFARGYGATGNADTADETQIPSDPFNPRNPRLLFSTARNCQSQEDEQNTEQRTRPSLSGGPCEFDLHAHGVLLLARN